MSKIDLADLDFAESSAAAINGVWIRLADSAMEFHVRPINDRLRAWTVFTIDCRGPVRVREPVAPAGGVGDRDWPDYLAALERYDAALGVADREFTRNMYDRMHEFLAEHVVIDWKQVQLRGGVEIPYAPDTARELFGQHPRLAQQVFDAAREAGGEDQVDFEEAGEKKAGAPDGGSDGVNTSKTLNASDKVAGALQH